MVKTTSNQFLFFRMFYRIFNEIQTSFPPNGVRNTNILVPALTFHVLRKLTQALLLTKIYKCLTTSDHRFKSVQFFKNFTFNVCKPPTQLDYLLNLKQTGDQSILSCIKTKIKCTGYFKCKAKMLWGESARGERGITGEREEICHRHNPQWLPSLTLVSFAFVICLRVSLTGTNNRIAHCSRCLNSLGIGSPEQSNLNEIKVSQGQYLFLS